MPEKGSKEVGLPYIMKFFIILFFLSVSFAFGAEDIETSTSAYKNKQKNVSKNSSLTLNMEKTRHDSELSLDYSVKWDFSDITALNIFSKKFYLSLNPLGGWDITDNTKFKMYGFSLNPWRIIIKKEKEPVGGSGIFLNKEAGANSKRSYKKRVRFSLYPVYNELTKDMESQIKEILLKESFRGRLPGWEDTDRKTKKLFINDLLSVDDLWDIPGMNKTKEGFEYLGK